MNRKHKILIADDHPLLRKVVFLSIFFTLLFLPQIIFAQYSNLKFENFSRDEGLSVSAIRSILQDREGFIWFGTNSGGINRHDGYGFKVYNDVSHRKGSYNWSWIRVLYEDNNGVLWIGTDVEGLSKFDKSTESFENFFNDPDNNNSISDNSVNTIYMDSGGSLWVGCKNTGLDKFDEKNKRFIHYRHNENDSNSINGETVWAIYEDRSGNFWIGTDKGLDRFDSKEEVFFHYKDFLGGAANLRNNIIQCIYEDNAGVLWLGTEYGLNKVSYINQEIHCYKTYCFTDSKSGSNVSSIHQDSNGFLWIGTFGDGLIIFNPATEKFTNFRNNAADPESLCSDRIERNSIIEDRSKNIWIGTSFGISKYSKNNFNFYPYKEGVGAFTIFEDKNGNLWITGNNNFHIRNTNGTFNIVMYDFPDNQSPSTGWIYQGICDKSGTIWLGYRSGLYKYSLDTKQLNHFYTFLDEKNLPSPDVAAIFEDSDSLLWIATSKGVWVFNKDRTKPKKFIHDNNNHYSINSDYTYVHMYEDRSGAIWITLWENGVDKYDKKTGRFYHYKNIPSDSNSIGSNIVCSLYDDGKGSMWIAACAGLDRLNLSTNTFTHFTEKNGLADSYTVFVLPDNSGNLWVATNSGISKFNPVTQTFRNYDKNDGLQGVEFIDYAYKTGKGEMFFCGANGITYFFPDSIKENKYIPPVFVTSFRVFEKEAELGKSILKTDEIKLSYKDNFFSFEFAALDYTNPTKNQYAYMLEGVDKDWVHTVNSREAHYTNIDPGEYAFRVKGSNNDGVWNETGVSIRIIITPPWWKTWWFRAFAVLAIAGVFGGSVRYVTVQRYKRRLALEKERSRISKDMHDEVGSSLTKIAILSEITGQNVENPENVKSNIQKISASAREVVDNISEIIWAINPKNDTLDNLLAYIREYTAETLEMKNIDYKIELPDDIPHPTISAETRRNVFLVIKESLNNTIKYADANMVDIKVILSERMLNITVKDNGKGFETENTRRFGNGLINMKKRMEDIEGEFELNSKIGAGTEIKLSVNIGR